MSVVPFDGAQDADVPGETVVARRGRRECGTLPGAGAAPRSASHPGATVAHAPRQALPGHRPAPHVGRRPRPRDVVRVRCRPGPRCVRGDRASGLGRHPPGRPAGRVLQRLAAQRAPLGRRPRGRGHRDRARTGHQHPGDGPAPRVPPGDRRGRPAGSAVRLPGEGDRRCSHPPARRRAGARRCGRPAAAQRAQAPLPTRACRRPGSADATYEAIRRARYLRNWVEDNGAMRVDGRFTPDEGARLMVAVAAETDRLAAAARTAGVDDPRKALAADALIGLACTWRGRPGADATPATPSPRATVHVRVDHAALQRGHVEPGELCEIPGVGPVPVEVARRLVVDSVLNVLVTDGVDVTAVAHAGRTIPIALRRALVERDPECVVPGCDRERRAGDRPRRPLRRGRPRQPRQSRPALPLAPLPQDPSRTPARTDVTGHGSDRTWRWIAPDDPPVVPRHILRSG